MNLENIISEQVIVKLGWSLIHFLWEGTAVALLLAIVLKLLRKSSANLRYAVACLALAVMVLLPVVTFRLVTAGVAEPVVIEQQEETLMPESDAAVAMMEVSAMEIPDLKEGLATEQSVFWKDRIIDALKPALVYIVFGWLAGVFGLSVWHLGGWVQLQKIRRKLVKQVSERVRLRAGCLAKLMGIKRVVNIMESALVQVPTAVGWLKPVILLPCSALSGLNGEQIEAILAHELAHIKRCDYLVNMLQTVVEILGFYHPAVWWVSGKIRAERENCCDDMAVSISGDRVCYARALTTMEEIRAGQPALAVAASGGSLFERIRRLLGKNSANEVKLSWLPSVIAILIIMAFMIPVGFAMSSRSIEKTDVQVEGADEKVERLNSVPVEGRYEVSGTVYEPVPDSWWEDFFARIEAIESEEEFNQYFKKDQDFLPQPSGAPGVDVTLRGDSITREAITDEEGKYKFSNLPEGTYSVSCERIIVSTRTGRGRKAIAKGDVRFNPRFPSCKVDLRLRDDQINVKGRIIDANGQPIQGAKITAIWGINDHEVANYWDNHEHPKWFSVSEDDGSYVVEGIERAKVNFYRIAISLCSDGRPYTYVDIRVEADGFVQNKNNMPRVPLVTEDVLYRARRFIDAANKMSMRAGAEKPGLEEEEGLSLPSVNGNTITGINVVLEHTGTDVQVEGEKDKKANVIYGIIRDQLSNPVSGALVLPLPHGGHPVETDVDGKFELAGPNEDRVIETLFARDISNNLAATAKFDNSNNTLDITLAPAITLTGRLTDPQGKTIPKVKVSPSVYNAEGWHAGFGYTVFQPTDSNGIYEIKSLAVGQDYEISAHGVEGYGVNGIRLGILEQPGIKHVEDIVLEPANLSVSGVVLDENLKPMSNVFVKASGERQPTRKAKTDSRGRFKIDKVCKGRLSLDAWTSDHIWETTGDEANGGDSDVEIYMIKATKPRACMLPPKNPPASLVGKKIPNLETLGIRLPENDIKGKRILVCFWKLMHDESRDCIRQLAARNRELAKKNIIIVAAQIWPRNERQFRRWLERNNIRFPVSILPDPWKQQPEQRPPHIWGMQNRVPWLIITGADHIVQAEGFALKELDEKIQLTEIPDVRVGSQKKADRSIENESVPRVIEIGVKQAAHQLLSWIQNANYENVLSYYDYDAGKWRNDGWKKLLPSDQYYMARTSFPNWVKWICETFKDNPINSFELGEVFLSEKKIDGLIRKTWPTVPYKLVLKDGGIIEGNLLFRHKPERKISMFRTIEAYWQGMLGLDWHLQDEPIKKPEAQSADSSFAPQILTSAYILSVPPDLPQLKEIISDDKSKTKMITAKKLDMFLSDIGNTQGAKIIAAPLLLTNNEEIGEIRTENAVGFDSIKIDIKNTVGVDRKTVRLELDFEYSVSEKQDLKSTKAETTAAVLSEHAIAITGGVPVNGQKVILLLKPQVLERQFSKTGIVTSCKLKTEKQVSKQANLEVLDIDFEPIHQGKNVVQVGVKNKSDKEQVFAVHIYTRSPDYGKGGIGWGTRFFDTVGPQETKLSRFVYKIQGPVTDNTWLRLKFYNPQSPEAYDYEKYFKEKKYSAGDLKRREDIGEDFRWRRYPQTGEILQAFEQIQNYIRNKKYQQAWRLFSEDYKKCEYQGRGFEAFKQQMEPTHRLHSAFIWEREDFLELKPTKHITRKDDVFTLHVLLEEQLWKIDFVREDKMWKVDWIAGYTPRVVQNWEDHILPKMETHRTQHFDIYYFKDSTAEKEIEQIGKQKEKGFEQICRFLGKDSDIRICLVLFEDGRNKLRETGHQGTGWAYGRTNVEVYNPEEKCDPHHETTHILMSSHGNPPAMFNEGFAVYMQAGHIWDGQHIDKTAADLLKNDKLTPLNELITRTEIGSRNDDGKIAYPQSASFVKFLIDTFGKNKFLQAYKSLKNSEDKTIQQKNIQMLEQIYGRTLQQLEKQWQDALLMSQSNESISSTEAKIEVQARFLLISDDVNAFKEFYEDEGIDFPRGQEGPNFASILTDEQVGKLLKLAQAEPYYKQLAAPKVKVLDGERAAMQIQRTIMYDQADSNQTEPKKLPVGTTLEVKPVLEDGGEKIMLEIEFEQCSFLGFENEAPLTKTVTASTQICIPNGSTALLGGHKITKEIDGRKVQKVFLCLVKAEKAEAENADKD